MMKVLKVLSVTLLAWSFSGAAQINPMFSGMGLGQDFSGAGSFGVSCACARSVAAGMNQDPMCEQNVKAMVDRAIQSNPQLNPLQFQMPGHLPQQGPAPAGALPQAGGV